MEATESEERTWAMLCHLSGLAGYVVPFGHIAGPLLIWLLKREGLPLVDDQGKEALNFQLSMTIYVTIAIVLVILVVGILLLLALLLLDVIMVVIAAVRANSGERYRYPLCIRFIS